MPKTEEVQETEAERIERLVGAELARRGAAQHKSSADLDKRCLTCGTDLIRDRNEWACPADGHRFQVQDGVLVVAARKLYGPGPDGVPDRRRYPSLDGGMGRRTTEPKDSRPRGYDPMDEEAKRAAREQQQRAAQRA